MILLKKLLNGLNRIVEYAVSLLLIVMVVVVFLQVIFRFVLHSSLPWSEELSRYILVWISFLGASIGVKRGAHIGVEVVVNMLPPKMKKGVAFLATLCAAVFFALMVIYGRRILFIVSGQRSPAMEISMGIPYSAIFVSGVLMFIYSIEQALSIVVGRRDEAI
ncbi:MAG: TRAP transporter small permease [Aminobacterium sp.]|uniref:TRAP transporter small permease n=1 Tax=unclassified Aminobacterium TaxID=2685012 RepID=UPI0027DC4C86|nr:MULTISPECIES: TRAP transporter small permease [unclassified Aminobacterium]MDD2206374.1 TRAP transporter small permease [Aminobacterium sp.]MDD3426490.1 TRAP transporter small permease [Aminobacterium sp.]MDD3707479.1 TRAP transporter small permease [Aminobacterium sp.]MDD4228391.1 TRAP transporter small permease [Aminobacterium sp.]MDD4552287.1 TRAP transporter small permease [Aminobacterium sp.]